VGSDVERLLLSLKRVSQDQSLNRDSINSEFEKELRLAGAEITGG
jgi:hypothetical protein